MSELVMLPPSSEPVPDPATWAYRTSTRRVPKHRAKDRRYQERRRGLDNMDVPLPQPGTHGEGAPMDYDG